MLLIPAMEINHGQCVHNQRCAESEEAKLITEDPVELAGKFISEGATRLHFVDVEAVISGEPENAAVIQKVRREFPDVMIQVSGNIRKEEHIYVWLDAGANYVVLSSQASKRKAFIEDMCIEFPMQVMIALETKNGLLKSAGSTAPDLVSHAQALEELGVGGLIYTDVPCSGHVNGNNLISGNRLANQLEIPVFTNGGINNLDDLRSLDLPSLDKLSGVVIGKALIENKLTLKEAVQWLRKASSGAPA